MRITLCIILLLISGLIYGVALQKESVQDSVLLDRDTTNQVVGLYLDSLSNRMLNQNAPLPIKASETPSFGSMMFRMIVSLIVIAIILYFVLLFVKRLNQGTSINSQKKIKVLETSAIGLKHQIQILHIDQSIYIISNNSGNTVLLDKISHPDEVKRIIEEINVPKQNFKSIIDQFKQMKKG